MNAPARSVDEVSAPYANFMLNPAPAGAGICSTCWRFSNPDFSTCYECGHQPAAASAVVPITYSIEREQMHHSLRNYKDGATTRIRDRFTVELAAVAWRFLRDHEPCMATAAGAPSFQTVTVVPSGTVARDDARPRLRTIFGQVVKPTAARFERLLAPTDSNVPGHQFDLNRFRALRSLDGADVLLVDDTWTTGASVQSAACALKLAGARRVGVLVIGRHVDPAFRDNGDRVKALPRPFDWATCAAH
jgi:predicted amidophosphoribosyltransferase